MAWKGIKHTDVGNELDKTEFHSEELHELDNGTELPETANDGDFFYKTNEHKLYIYVSE
ncbi:unnamed protein product [marine sediment metagenome]|uniref:Uncharacterized protein n=1 Tax=marine sediment metagenome TaxID=412755 RepID=X1DCV1_9ZZZZ